jgi:hypothetical protein
MLYIILLYTAHTQKNGAVSNFIKKCISHATGHNIYRQQRELSKFLIHYQQFAFHAYCGAAEPVSKMASQHEKAFWVLRFEVSRSVITVQCQFQAWFKKNYPCVVSLF